MRGALCVATRLYILYLAADESISGWEFLLLIPKSPQITTLRRAQELEPQPWIQLRVIQDVIHIYINIDTYKHIPTYIVYIDSDI